MRTVPFLLLGLLLFLFERCKKYPEDDNGLHLRSVKSRLCGGYSSKSWVPAIGWRHLVTNILVSIAPDNYMRFYRDGRYKGTFCSKYELFQGVYYNSGSCVYKGTWQLSDKKNKLILTTDQGVSDEYSIIKLDYDEFWFQNDTILYGFKKKTD